MGGQVSFACAPAPAPGELLGSWVCRLATGHGVTVSRFLEGAPKAAADDIDWDCAPQLLDWLSRGSGRSRRELAAMTLRVAFPDVARRNFGLGGGASFPGCHPFCPRCAEDDVARYGQPIMRMRDAGTFCIGCPVHGVVFDGADHPRELIPARGPDRRWRSNLRGRSAVDTPRFAIAFERAAARALSARPAGAAWWVREPSEFLRIARQLAALVVVQRSTGTSTCESAALALLDEKELRFAAHGNTAYDRDYLDRMPAWLRTRALMAVAVLLLRPAAARRLKVDEWAELRIGPFCRGRDWIEAPWRVAGEAWAWPVLELILGLSETWPAELQSAALQQLRPVYAKIGRSLPLRDCQDAQRTL